MTELGAQEITELVEKASELGVQLGLPTTKAGVKKRADSQNWQTRTVKGKGGRAGLKTLYSLPTQVIEELEKKGLSHLLKMGNNTSVTVAPTKAAQPIQPSLPVHYHTNVFGSVGNGYEMLESVKTKVMWFRSSFFNLLGAPPARCFCTHVRGESMHPTLIDKGTVMWQMQNSYTY